MCDGERADYRELTNYFVEQKIRKLMLVCGNSVKQLRIGKYLDTLEERTGIKVVRFQGFQPNPDYESVVAGVELFRKEGCELVLAVGGGSAMDVAKCIKLFATMDESRSYLEQKIVANSIKLVAVPTTAGSGSEATHFAVIYIQGAKQSIAHESCIPQVVLWDPTVLESLPLYQKKATMLDALCHAVESCWSVRSTIESRKWALEAIERLCKVRKAYLCDATAKDVMVNAEMLQIANLAGRAINVTQTTAGHAMCYKLTGLYQIAHGHAAALCVARLFPHMIENIDKCMDPRGKEYLQEVLASLAKAMGCENATDAARFFQELLEELKMEDIPFALERENRSAELKILKSSVNLQRLHNHPIALDETDIEKLYLDLLSKGGSVSV